MSENHVVLNVHMEAVPGHEEELAGLLTAMVGPTHEEPGCITYELHRDPANPAKFMFYERFASQEALDSHAASPHLVRFRETRAGLNPDPLLSSAITKWRCITS